MPARTARPRASTNEAAPAQPPARAASLPAPVEAVDATVNRYLAAYIMGIANRLANGASNHYRRHFDLGMSEWRAMMALGSETALIVREVAERADLDYAAASKSVRVLEQRGLVSVEQTSTRGRASIVRLTADGSDLFKKLRDSARRRQKRLVADFSAEEVQTLWALLRRVERQVPHMNAE